MSPIWSHGTGGIFETHIMKFYEERVLLKSIYICLNKNDIPQKFPLGREKFLQTIHI